MTALFTAIDAASLPVFAALLLIAFVAVLGIFAGVALTFRGVFAVPPTDDARSSGRVSVAEPEAVRALHRFSSTKKETN